MDITDIVAGGFFFGLSNRPFYITTSDRIEPLWLFSCLDIFKVRAKFASKLLT